MRLFSILLSLLMSMPVLCSVSEKLTENKALVSKSFEFREKFGFDLLQQYSEEGFAAGTLVATSDGYKLIEIINKDDLVIDHYGVSKKVLKVATKNVSQYVQCVIDDQEIQTGRDQLFYLSHTQQWCKARDLKNHEIIESSLKTEIVKLYQLTVEDHVFSIEKSNIVVHNVDFLVTPAGALFYIASAANPVTAVIGATVGLSAITYSAYMIHQAQQVAHLSQIAMHQKQQEQNKNDAVCAIEKDVAKNQEAIVKVDQISKDVQCNKALEKRSKTLEKLKRMCKERASAASDNGPMINGPEEPEDEEEKKIKEEEEFKKKHSNGRYDDVGYHKNYQSGSKSPRPLNGQKALDNSFEVPDKEKIRIALSDDQFVVLTRTLEGLYHGHVRAWRELTQDMRNVLINQGLVKDTGKIIRCK